MRTHLPSDACDLCGQAPLDRLYEPDGTRRGLAVFVCPRCALVQSLPRIDHIAARPVAVSAAADWGNLRYGKGFHADAALKALAEAADLGAMRRVLDVGANRGGFALALLEAHPHLRVTAIEPDGGVTGAYADHPAIALRIARIEEVALPEGGFDLIHCSHTLEHLASPRRTLSALARALAPDGLLYLEVPDLAFLDRDDLVEEWFIDKHLYHFSRACLAASISAAGLAVVAAPKDPAGENLVLIARRSRDAAATSVAAPQEVAAAHARLARYGATRRANRAALAGMSRAIAALAPRRVVIWGAGRLLDSLLREGGLDLAAVVGVVDTRLSAPHLAPHAAARLGRPILAPDALPGLAPDVVVVAARRFLAEIRAEVAARLPGCAVLGYGELLARSRSGRPIAEDLPA